MSLRVHCTLSQGDLSGVSQTDPHKISAIVLQWMYLKSFSEEIAWNYFQNSLLGNLSSNRGQFIKRTLGEILAGTPWKSIKENSERNYRRNSWHIPGYTPKWVFCKFLRDSLEGTGKNSERY